MKNAEHFVQEVRQATVQWFGTFDTVQAKAKTIPRIDGSTVTIKVKKHGDEEESEVQMSDDMIGDDAWQKFRDKWDSLWVAPLRSLTPPSRSVSKFEGAQKRRGRN